jgi:hypothetical protein
MAFGSVANQGSSGENISHFAAIRVRVLGVGNLLMSVLSLDAVKSKTLVPFVMQTTNRILPTRIVNFNEQRAQFELKTTAIGEKFRINRIVVFVKEIYTSHPGN